MAASLVGMDDSHDARDALAFAPGDAARRGTGVHVVTAVLPVEYCQVIPGWPKTHRRTTEELRRAGCTKIRQVVAEVRAALETAGGPGADMQVLGTRSQRRATPGLGSIDQPDAVSPQPLPAGCNQPGHPLLRSAAANDSAPPCRGEPAAQRDETVCAS